MLLTLLFFLVFLTRSFNSGVSAVLAGLVCALPNAFFARQFLQRNGAQQVKKIVSLFYRGEAVKLLLSAGLFALVFAWHDLVPEVFFAVYLMVLLAHVFAPWFFVNRNSE